MIDFGLKKIIIPSVLMENDAGADVYMPYDYTLKPGEIVRIPLGFGLMIPDGLARIRISEKQHGSKGLVCELPPIDSGYRGEIHAIISNVSSESQILRKDTPYRATGYHSCSNR
ncbi:MAG: deoxyuridine 5'-triphosphate nucleotidohydrolase [Ruminococcus sp.]